MRTLFLFAYLGPETLLPMTSVLAAAVGFAAMFGRNVFVLATKILRSILRIPRRFSKSSQSPLPRLLRQDQRQGEWRGPLTNNNPGEVLVVEGGPQQGTQTARTSR